MSEIGKFTATLKETLNYKYVIDVDNPLDVLKLDDISTEKQKIAGRSSFIVEWNNKKIAVSVWVSAKRTRSYPYTRIYQTLSKKDLQKITIIPIVKDEGKGGCNDYIQWDTFSLCTYLGLYVIPGYHVKATQKEKKGKLLKNKIDNQEFDPTYITKKIKEIFNTTLTPKEWNINERLKVGELAEPTITGHEKIQRETGVQLHDVKYIRRRFEIMKKPDEFKKLSQKLSEKAQKRETKTKQPKEEDFDFQKARVTCYDKNDGKYSWTADGYQIEDSKVFLIEMKHAQGKNPPSTEDVEDAFFKFHFFANISNLKDEHGKEFEPIPTIVMSSTMLSGACFTTCPYFQPEHDVGSTCVDKKCDEEILKSINIPHELIQKDEEVQKIFKEGLENNILIIAIGMKNYKKGLLPDILSNYVKQKSR